MIQAEGYLTLEWRDPRLALPEAARVQGHLRELKPGETWTPPIETANLISHHSGNVLLSTDDDGNIRYVERSDITVSNTYSLRSFPFDSQTLKLYVEPFLPASSDIRFAAKPAEWNGLELQNEGTAAWQVQGLDYQVSEVPQSGPIPAHSSALFQVRIRRRSSFYVWKIFLPIVLMAAIPWCVFWSDDLAFDDQMGFPLGIMLSMVAFQFAVSRDLPRVGYITFLDAVLLTSFVFVVLCMVEIVAVHLLQSRDRNAAGVWIRRQSRWFFPATYISAILLLALFF